MINSLLSQDCDDGYDEDCHDENDCLLESWIGDGYPDCWLGTMWDLSCYDIDGGDCLEVDDLLCPFNNDSPVNVLAVITMVDIILEGDE